MRNIEFRGLTKDGNGFIYGLPTYDFEYLFNENGLDSPDNYTIKKSTLGQFTGLLDKNGVKIFEGDILIHNKNIYYVKFSKNQYVLLIKNIKTEGWKSLEWCYSLNKYIEIIGNIHQNPELLKK
jgi:uncharacterized phage protein (TIGR01671 family)